MSRLFAILVTFALVATGAGQDASKPPAKADEKKAEPKKSDPKDGDTPPAGDEVDVQKTAERIAENAQKAGDRLKDKDPGADTRKIQQEILKDIDALLKKAQQPPPPPPDMPPPDMPPDMPPPQGGMPPPKGGMPPPKGGGGMPPPKAGMPMGGGNGAAQPKGGSGGAGKAERRPRKERRPRGDSPMPMGMGDPMANAGPGGTNLMGGRPDPKTGPKDKDDKPGGENTGARGGPLSPKRQSDKLADLYKDVWGTLPDRLRQEMDLYYREQFMPRYSELLRQYYAALAEQRKKGTEDR